MWMIHRVRGNWHCVFCHNTIFRGAFCIADDEQMNCKICLSCAESKIDERIKAMKETIRTRVKHLKNLKRKLMRNKEKYQNNNALASLQHEGKD